MGALGGGWVRWCRIKAGVMELHALLFGGCVPVSQACEMSAWTERIVGKLRATSTNESRQPIWGQCFMCIGGGAMSLSCRQVGAQLSRPRVTHQRLGSRVSPDKGAGGHSPDLPADCAFALTFLCIASITRLCGHWTHATGMLLLPDLG